MKKSKIVNLVLITAALASCNKTEKKHEKKYFMRGDTTAAYEAPVRNHQHHNGVSPIIWFYAFRPYGFYDSHTSRYVHSGSYSSSVSESSNIGRSASKSGVIRGGLGGGRFSVSS